MTIRPYSSLTPPAAEIGRDGDWDNAALVEELGASDDGETRIMLTLSRTRLELWHRSGLTMRIPLDAMIDEACAVLSLEACSQELADAEET